ncbi:DUF881 domain-containing protein [Marihabitans asiaticum]|uniref:Uncharacterized protein YlxW (UPF0749 family) n=1 Tax=Marihabitans asiaticum TaxID=415218 RepID=A0A560WG21_9MICO|nr:DUF881 domain-containing protein [Marihabitans asiaticum]TWD16629.1 uncharacterized protein YlxW (UPF0749 family) [Marihabitans asiaticum]
MPSKRETASSSRLRMFLDSRASGWSALVPVIALAAGLLFGVTAATAQGEDLRSDIQTVPDLIRDRAHDNSTRELAVERLRREVDEATVQAGGGDGQLQALTDDIQGMQGPAGFAAVSGPSLTVSLDDAPLDAADLPEGYDVNDIVVHQQDVQGVVNAMWRGGAEAMMIQDQRVISTSAVRCVGNTLILQGRVYAPPFVITAIGDQEAMRTALDEDPTVSVYREYVDAIGLGYEVSTSDKTGMPPYSGQGQLKHARAVR